ncbi:kinesin family member C1 [Sporothrix schenckii 1099-18]|uniref:Kinesin-like protein n=1 Tax=Sporothrix schenckii 1099-18 TaxID=1397361 RepID=A0A0F2MHH9_SPOSC|nr:kinesin family member C1 [Sporothrix schenckii 1099-18]KJR87626.1 kinesin family member C1 [Sporothrix schenckii 1099-18]
MFRQQLQSAIATLENVRHEYSHRIDDQSREHRHELDRLRKELREELQQREWEHKEAMSAMDRNHKANQAEEYARAHQEMQSLQANLQFEHQSLKTEMRGKEHEIEKLRAVIENQQSNIDRECSFKSALQEKLLESSSQKILLEDRVHMLQTQVDFLKSDSKQKSDQFSVMEARLQDALKASQESRQRLIKEEAERRVLFNKYQELKGNIRVMCRVRPVLGTDAGSDAKFRFPDATTSSSQIDVTGPEEKNSLGVVCRRTATFEFDRVFQPAVQNEEVFGEISQLVQSALDGYNVCIFCYGQTGSGKTYTMFAEGGVISLAAHMIYDNIRLLGEKQWSYTVNGSFVEVYNEELHDLLSNPNCGGSKDQEPKKRLEIRHDDIRNITTIVNCKTVRLGSSDEVNAMLNLAHSNRSVAATGLNERSSRSHSIFILDLVGENAATGEQCHGTLNLVDLAGSERLKQSGAEGDRMKETQSINRSLACLGDVIEALGRGASHIPYRNSKLTHLLQYSLGGNSKTLMFVMISPLEQHLKESLTSLRFATKVKYFLTTSTIAYNCTIY